MRILILSHEYPPIGGGGGQAAQDIAQELTSRGHEITILTAHLKGLPRDELVENIRVLRLHSMRRHPYRASFLEMGAYVLAAIRAGIPLIRRWRPDLIHVHFAVPAGAAAWILAQLTAVPYVLTAHLGDIPGGVPEKTGGWFRWVFPFTKPIWRNAARVTTVSEYTRTLICQHYPLDPIVIPNGINIKIVKPDGLSIHNPPAVVFAGRFMPQKNLIGLVKTLALVRDIPWKCSLLGNGPLFEEVKHCISSHGLDERFDLPGWVTTEQVLDKMAQSDLLFMPSLSEGLPVVGLQALAMGLAIVASRVGGNVDLVDQGNNGFLADPGDLESLSTALRSLLNDREALQKARQASRAMAERFDIRSVVDQYEAIFREIVS
jgi:L-malate glycosyltransferase